jgi:chemotaxis protein methyltransferase WspC
MSFAFRKAGAKQVESTYPIALAPRKRAGRRMAPQQQGLSVEPHPLATPSAPLRTAPPEDLKTAHLLADAGQLPEAAEWCESYLRRQGPSSEAYFLLALTRDGLGDSRGAIDCYRKAVYLEPNHSEALMHLALLTERLGDSAAAQRLRQRALRVGESSEQRIS